MINYNERIDYCVVEDAYEVFNKVFEGVDKEQFVNKHTKNPHCLKNSIYYLRDNNKMVGINGFMGCMLSCNNKLVKAAQSCDTAVLQEYRGKGVFTQIISGAETSLMQEGVQILIGLPNDKSYNGFIKMGWNDLEEICTEVFRLDILGARGKKSKILMVIDDIWNRIKLLKIRKSISTSYRIETYDSFPFDKEDIEIINNKNNMTFFRDEEYYRWRLERKKVKYVKAFFNNMIVGYIIFRKSNDGVKDIVEIIDYWVTDVTKEKMQIIATMIHQVHSIYSGYIVIPFFNIKGSEAKMMKKLGFIVCNNRSKLIYKILDKELQEECAFREFQIRLLDVDTFVNDNKGD